MIKSDRFTYFIVVASVIILVLLSLFSACIGSYSLSISDIGDILFNKNAVDSTDSMVFYQLRLPRIAIAILGGVALGISGGVYQLIFESPLAAPDLTGVSSGAALGAAIAIVVGGGVFTRIGFAFIGGMITLALVLLIAYFVRATKIYVYILVGLIISSAAQAGLMILKAFADKEGTVVAIEYWTMGTFSAITSQKLLYSAIIAIPTVLFLLIFEKQTKILSLGSETALSLGLSVSFWRAILLIFSTLAVSSIVSVSGIIGFVGLIAPHIAFLLVKHKGKFYLFLCGIVGGNLTILADLLARSILDGTEIPLSVFTIIFAVPILIILLLKWGRKNA